MDRKRAGLGLEMGLGIHLVCERIKGWSEGVEGGVRLEVGDGQREGRRGKGWEWINWKDQNCSGTFD